MLRWLRQRAETSRKAEELYGNVVAAARQPDFYGALGVPDTPEGRFELVALHLFLALEVLRGKGADAEALARRTIETFVIDMDDCMREMGVGDLTVPKKVKRAAAAFYERASIYRQDLIEDLAQDLAQNLAQAEPGAPRLTKSLRGYVFANSVERGEGAAGLAHYMQAASSALADHAFGEFVNAGMASRLLAAATSKHKVSMT
ncbi:ubiquinol-cytochrome C chaperone family protein [Hyphomicrobium facile]|uniref:Cytochrome b pre-mRNA-processing protein 3 n=1 Tax=Hyphomicrobium facile TaxID=51670 RepID=A0A1I7NEA0_9HYPH|nr:ubiquinol-cytochrome C chaperone family protein [Hyphomicrobium facile]SFV32981.1 cytochrome b pre-mRNA-processing protein 3 [Hyphomicrobium facile]